MNIPAQAYAFRLNGQPVSCTEFGHGHINKTLKIVTDTQKEYILQNINKYVFKDPVKVMENVVAVTAFLHDRLDDPNGALHFIPTIQGTHFYRDPDGEFWRMYDFVHGFCLDMPETQEDFYESALAFGRFQHLLSDFPAHTLYETIPNFHNTPDRFRQLHESIQADLLHRADTCREEIAFALSLEEKGGMLQRMLENGELPLRVTHNDTKMNNVLLHRQTRKSLCVLDLDTVMPGLSAHDFGDSIRFGAATAAEDTPNPECMKLNLDLFRIYAKGFLTAAPSLTEAEVQALPWGALIMTLEVGIRFLKDYLDGDIYFKISYENHNLIRARAQLALAADMLAKWEDMISIVAQIAKEIKG